MALDSRGQVVPNAPQVSWKVISQQERFIPSPQGTVQDMIQVTFQMPDGTTGTVNVDKQNYSAANVRAAIANYAGRLSEVAGLTG